MGCGCSSNTSSAQSSVVNDNIHAQNIIEDCPYTLEQINNWLVKVRCFKDNNLQQDMPNITIAMLNSYIGTLLSTLNYSSNICYFNGPLQDIENFITIVISTGRC